MNGGLLRLTIVLGIAIGMAGCATSNAMRRGLEAEGRQDYDEAIADYSQVLKAHPNAQEARSALDRARLQSANDHLTRARRLTASGKYEDALVEYQQAADLNPSSDAIDQELRDVRTKLQALDAGRRGGPTALEAMIERARALPADGLELPPDVKMPASLVFRDTSSRDVFVAIARLADLSLVFDPTFRESPLTIDLRNASLQDALKMAAGATQTFVRMPAAKTIAVIPDTPAKRREFEDKVVQTFYLSNADLKETMDLLRQVVDMRSLAPISGSNAITIKDTPENIAAAARIIAAIDKARPEVIVDVELLEVDRTRLLEYGLQIASPGSPGINGQVATTSVQATTATATAGTATLQGLSAPSASMVAFANLPGLYYRLLKSDANTRTLANPQLRTSDGVPAQAKFGDRVPVPVTTFAPIATGGTPQQPVTSYNYENVGVNIDITPRTHFDGEVTLALKVAVSAIEPTTGFGGLPEFSNREVNTTIQLRDGETSMLAGLITDDETKLIEGIPGLSNIPGIGRIFSHTQKQTTQTDVVLMLTPHIIRSLDVAAEELRPFEVGSDAAPPVQYSAPTGAAAQPARDQPAASSPVDLAGTWGGTLTAIPGTPQMTWTLTTEDIHVEGSVTVAFAGFAILNGTISGTLDNGALTYTIAVPAGGFPTAPTCVGQLAGTATVTSTTISGNATPGTISCVPPVSTVSFVLSKQ